MTDISIGIAVFAVLGAISVTGLISASRTADRLDRLKRSTVQDGRQPDPRQSTGRT